MAAGTSQHWRALSEPSLLEMDEGVREAACSVHRYYDPVPAQFLSVDALVETTGQPYGYAGDNPLNTSDPTGLQPSSLPVTYGTIVAADCEAVVAQINRGDLSAASTMAIGVSARTGVTWPVGGTGHLQVSGCFSFVLAQLCASHSNHGFSFSYGFGIGMPGPTVDVGPASACPSNGDTFTFGANYGIGGSVSMGENGVTPGIEFGRPGYGGFVMHPF